MYKHQSIKEIGSMTASRRLKLAQDKLSNDKNEGVVNEVLSQLSNHENTRWILYSSHLAQQVPTSYAANAFNSFRIGVLHYEIIRLCSFWDPIDLDSRSIPTIVALADCRGVSDLVYGENFSHYENFRKDIAKESATKARTRLRTGIRRALKIEKSEMLKHTRNFRDKLAHQLEKTRREKDEPIPAPLLGDEGKLLRQTVTVINNLYLSLNGTSFAWDEAKHMRKRNAQALWKGVTIKPLR